MTPGGGLNRGGEKRVDWREDCLHSIVNQLLLRGGNILEVCDVVCVVELLGGLAWSVDLLFLVVCIATGVFVEVEGKLFQFHNASSGVVALDTD